MHNTEFDELAGRIEGLARAVLLIAAGLEMAGLMDGPRLADDWRGVAQRLPAGQPVLSIQENRERTQFVFRAYHPKNVAWLADDLNRPIAYFIKLAMTARNIVKAKQWGRFNGTVSPEIEQAARLTPDQEFPLYQVLIPADELYAADHKRQRQVGGRYVSCYIDRSHKGYLHEGSMPVLNIVAPAYRRLSGMTRGFSPACWNALADARMLQAMALTIIEQAEKAMKGE